MRSLIGLALLPVLLLCLSCKSAKQQDQVKLPKFRTQLLDDQIQIDYGL